MLNVAIPAPGGWTWYARGDEGVRSIEFLLGGTGRRTWLHRRERREAWIDRGPDQAVFVKRVCLPDAAAVLRATFRAGGSWIAYKGALHEAERTVLAEARLKRVARLYALGERRRWGTVREEILVFEALLRHRTLDEIVIASRDDPPARKRALERGVEVLLQLDGARLVHLDLNPRNVMLHDIDPEQDCAVDIEQLVELDRPRPDLLAHGFGHLYTRGVQEHSTPDEYNSIAMPAMARALGTDEVPEDVLQYYDWFLGRSLGRRSRLRLARVGVGRIPWMRRRIAHRAGFVPLPSSLSTPR